jgi:hypothetical protein
MAGAPNPEAIAWYVKRSEVLLEDLRERVQSLRTRGGQLAGFSGAVLALAGGNVLSVLDALHGAPRSCAAISLSAGLLFLIVALVTTVRGTLVPEVVSDLSASEVANYTSERFTHDPDLWRVHVRAIRAVLSSIESTTRQGDEVARALKRAEFFFLVGLSSVGVAFATLITEVIF